jgi:hypothetical protein
MATEQSVTWPRWSTDIGVQISMRREAFELSFESLRGGGRRSPEAELALAIMLDAVECFRNYAWSSRKAERKLFREARHWLSGDAPSDCHFTCDFVCEVLGIDRSAVVRSLQAWYAASSRARANRTAAAPPSIAA